MQFSLRRLLLAVALFAATVGVLMLYAEHFGPFRSADDAAQWWVCALVTAIGASGTLLIVRRRDVLRIVRVALWTIAGLCVAGLFLSTGSPVEAAILSAVVVGVTGCITFVLNAL